LKSWLARFGYSTLLRALTPLYLLRLWWRGRREPLYRHALAQRLGFGYRAAAPGALWLHAVSLGETRAASALVDALRAQRPGLRLLLTHGTATGREAGRSLLREGDTHGWLPWDTPGAVRRFLRHHRPASASVCASTAASVAATGRTRAAMRSPLAWLFPLSRALARTIGTPSTSAACSRFGQISVSISTPTAGR
jgi:hypothetical protein